MTLISNLASTHQAHYKLKTEKFQFDKSLKQLEDELWASFIATTQFRGLIVDLETAFSAFAKKSLGSMPGLEVILDARIRPDLSQSRFNQPGLSGKFDSYHDCEVTQLF